MEIHYHHDVIRLWSCDSNMSPSSNDENSASNDSNVNIAKTDGSTTRRYIGHHLILDGTNGAVTSCIEPLSQNDKQTDSLTLQNFVIEEFTLLPIEEDFKSGSKCGDGLSQVVKYGHVVKVFNQTNKKQWCFHDSSSSNNSNHRMIGPNSGEKGSLAAATSVALCVMFIHPTKVLGSPLTYGDDNVEIRVIAEDSNQTAFEEAGNNRYNDRNVNPVSSLSICDNGTIGETSSSNKTVMKVCFHPLMPRVDKIYTTNKWGDEMNGLGPIVVSRNNTMEWGDAVRVSLDTRADDEGYQSITDDDGDDIVLQLLIKGIHFIHKKLLSVTTSRKKERLPACLTVETSSGGVTKLSDLELKQHVLSYQKMMDQNANMTSTDNSIMHERTTIYKTLIGAPGGISFSISTATASTSTKSKSNSEESSELYEICLNCFYTSTFIYLVLKFFLNKSDLATLTTIGWSPIISYYIGKALEQYIQFMEKQIVDLDVEIANWSWDAKEDEADKRKLLENETRALISRERRVSLIKKKDIHIAAAVAKDTSASILKPINEGTNAKATKNPLNIETTISRDTNALSSSSSKETRESSIPSPLIQEDKEEQLPDRFLAAAKGNVEQGWIRYNATKEWREKEGMDTILVEPHEHFHSIKHFYPHFFHFRGKKQESVYFETPAKMNIPALKKEGVDMKKLLRHFALVTEYQWNYIAPTDDGKSIYIIDLIGLGFRDFMGEVVDFVRKASEFTGQHYPERSAYIVVLNVPSWFSVVWAVIQPMIDPVTREKVSFVGFSKSEILAALKKRIDLENIPPEYGGSSVPLGQAPEEKVLCALMDRNNGKATDEQKAMLRQKEQQIAALLGKTPSAPIATTTLIKPETEPVIIASSFNNSNSKNDGTANAINQNGLAEVTHRHKPTPSAHMLKGQLSVGGTTVSSVTTDASNTTTTKATAIATTAAPAAVALARVGTIRPPKSVAPVETISTPSPIISVTSIPNQIKMDTTTDSYIADDDLQTNKTSLLPSDDKSKNKENKDESARQSDAEPVSAAVMAKRVKPQDNLETPEDEKEEKLPARFLAAGKGNVDQGWIRYNATKVWREKEGIDTILSEPHEHFLTIKQNWPHYFHLRGKKNECCYYEIPAKMKLGPMRKEGITMKELLRHYAMVTEFMWAHVEPSEEGKSIYVIDLEGLGLRDFMGEVVEFVKATASFTGQHYPERAGYIFVMNVPSWFSVIYSVVQPMIDPVTREKVKIVGKYKAEIETALKQCIDIENIPPRYGGKSCELGEAPEEKMFFDLMKRNNEQCST